MSTIDFRSKKVDKEQARKMLREIVAKHPTRVVFANHAVEEFAKDGYVATIDGWNVLKSTASRVTRVEPERGYIRYRFETKQIALVFEFWSDGKGLTVITGWAKKGVRR